MSLSRTVNASLLQGTYLKQQLLPCYLHSISCAAPPVAALPCCLLQAQNLLTSASLPEVSSAHSKLGAYAAALHEELAARQAALAALNAELAKQVSAQHMAADGAAHGSRWRTWQQLHVHRLAGWRFPLLATASSCRVSTWCTCAVQQVQSRADSSSAVVSFAANPCHCTSTYRASQTLHRSESSCVPCCAALLLQTAEVGRIESQLQMVGGQRQQLDARLANLASQLSAVAGLGALFQQQQQVRLSRA
jgi:hypothetical protein